MNKNSKIFIGTIALIIIVGSIFAISNKNTNTETTIAQNTEHENTDNTSHESSGSHGLDYHDQSNWNFESGKMQSPINISTKDTKDPENSISGIEVKLNNEIASIEDNGHSIQVNGSGSVKIDNRNFDFAQVHFHAKSEHTIDDVHYPIEAHFVNKSKNGRLAVIGVMFEESDTDNEAFGEILSQVKKGENVSNVSNIELTKMLPDNKSYFNYLGSLTTPPLSENVEWYVLKTPVKVSKNQISTFNTLYDFNNRAIQNIEDRVVLEYNE